MTPRGFDSLSRHFTGFIDDRDLTMGFVLLAVAASTRWAPPTRWPPATARP